MSAGGGTPPGPPQGNGYVPLGYAYIASKDTQQSGTAGSIYQYAIAADGSLSALGVPSVPTGVDPVSIVADSTGHFVYTANSGDNTISQFAVGTGGALTPLSPATISLPGAPSGAVIYSLSVDPAGPYLYVVAGWSVGQFSIGADGTLTPLSPAYVSAPSFPPAIPTSALAIDPTGAHAYLVGFVPTPGCAVCGYDNQLVQFAIGPDGALTAYPQVPVAEDRGLIVRIVIAPNGGTAYVLSQCIDTNCDGSIAPYAIASTGELSPAGAATLTGSHVDPVDLIIDGSGTSAYLLASLMGVDTDFGTVYQYSIDSTGAFSQMPASFPLNGGAVAESRYGPDLYVLSGAAGPDAPGVVPSVAIYSIGSQGELTSVGSTQVAASAPTGIVLIAAP
jgi:DNA-binding beta-propeller fold protein YncE